MIKQIFTVTILIALMTNVGLSQDSRRDKGKNHERMKAKKIAYITDALELTPSESEKFWPVYNEFKKEWEVLHDERHAYDKLGDVTEEEAKDLLARSLDRDRQEIELKERYNAKFLVFMPATKLVRLQGVERKFRKDILSSIKDRYSSRGKK